MNTNAGTGDSALPSVSARNNLLIRAVSALLLAGITIWGVVWSNFIFNILLIGGAVIAGSEWTFLVDPESRMVEKVHFGSGKKVILFLPAVLLIVWMVATRSRPEHYFIKLVVLSVLLIPLIFVRRFSLSPLVIAGVPYLGATLLSLMALHRAQNWNALIFLLVIVWATDTFAFAAGKLIGGPKLAPAISPGKTWAGSIGGVAGAMLVAVLLSAPLGGTSLFHSALVGCGISLLTQAGDLLESALKRRFGVKDSGFLIPGHGGILDRIDGLLLAAPIFTLYRLWLGGAL